MEQVSNLNCIPFVGEWSDLVTGEANVLIRLFYRGDALNGLGMDWKWMDGSGVD